MQAIPPLHDDEDHDSTRQQQEAHWRTTGDSLSKLGIGIGIGIAPRPTRTYTHSRTRTHACAQVTWVERAGRLVAWHEPHGTASAASSLLASGSLSFSSGSDSDSEGGAWASTAAAASASAGAAEGVEDLPGSLALAASAAAEAALHSEVKLGWPARQAAGETVTSRGELREQTGSR
jgi:hypothetical protein